jgi:hypothetical protein
MCRSNHAMTMLVSLVMMIVVMVVVMMIVVMNVAFDLCVAVAATASSAHYCTSSSLIRISSPARISSG